MDLESLSVWGDACTLYLSGRHSTAFALAITCLEEIGKISVARLELALFEHPGLCKAFQPAAKNAKPSRRNNPFYSHSQKLLLAAGAGALVNTRLDRLLGMEVVIAFLDDVEAEKIEHLGSGSV